MIKHLSLDHSETEPMSKLLIVTCLWYSIWHMRNDLKFRGMSDIKEVMLKFEKSVEKFGTAPKGLLLRSNAKVSVP